MCSVNKSFIGRVLDPVLVVVIGLLLSLLLLFSIYGIPVLGTENGI